MLNLQFPLFKLSCSFIILWIVIALLFHCMSFEQNRVYLLVSENIYENDSCLMLESMLFSNPCGKFTVYHRCINYLAYHFSWWIWGMTQLYNSHWLECITLVLQTLHYITSQMVMTHNASTICSCKAKICRICQGTFCFYFFCSIEIFQGVRIYRWFCMVLWPKACLTNPINAFHQFRH